MTEETFSSSDVFWHGVVHVQGQKSGICERELVTISFYCLQELLVVLFVQWTQLSSMEIDSFKQNRVHELR